MYYSAMSQSAENCGSAHPSSVTDTCAGSVQDAEHGHQSRHCDSVLPRTGGQQSWAAKRGP